MIALEDRQGLVRDIEPFGGFPGSGDTTVWWSAWYTKAGVLIAILGVGYGVRAWRSSAY
jgi:hypothetical protein